MASVYIRNGREKSLLRQHPWVFSGSVDHIEGSPIPGETVKVHAMDGHFLGWGAYSPVSQIRVRLWSFDPEEKINPEFLLQRVTKAIQYRNGLFKEDGTNAYRLIHAESDFLPGLIVEKYAQYLVVQFLSAGAEYWRQDIIAILNELLNPEGMYERSDVSVRELEGLPQVSGCISGSEPPELLQIKENRLNFWVDLQHGQKTGFYLDQRQNRALFSDLVNPGACLNCFAYTGAFTVYGLQAGIESTLSIDASEDALMLARSNVTLNQLPSERCEWRVDNVFDAMRTFRDEKRAFDTIVLDPPKFAPTLAQVQKAARAYKDINHLAFKLLKPGGRLFTFSCSGGISAELFQKIVADAALDAGVNARIISNMSQGPDHPTSLSFPEGAYLKGLVCQVD